MNDHGLRCVVICRLCNMERSAELFSCRLDGAGKRHSWCRYCRRTYNSYVLRRKKLEGRAIAALRKLGGKWNDEADRIERGEYRLSPKEIVNGCAAGRELRQ